jgi:hypothetical protein
MFMHQLLQDYFAQLLQNYFAEPLQDYFTVRRPEPDRGFPLECPNCGLLSPPSAMRCDCGYTFTARHR